MNPEIIMVRIGEIMLKGKNRSFFERLVIGNVKNVIKPFSGLKIFKEYGRIYIELNGQPFDQVAEVLQKVFGIISFSPVRKVPLQMEEILQAALQEVHDSKPQPKTFKVVPRRAYKIFPHDSMEISQIVGGHILKNTPSLKVDVHKPEMKVHVEIRKDFALVFSRVFPAASGFPIGSSGKALLMLSGGIDSPVAGWLAMRKGMVVEAVHFHSYPFTSERAKQKVIDLTNQLSKYAGRIKLHLVPFTEIQTKLRQDGPDPLQITLMRRAMFQIMTKIAQREKAMAIVTGESLGQVASQTLPSLYTIGHNIEYPILRPLIMMDKNEIIRIAKKIETYDISILPYEDCCTIFLPKSPSTNPNLRIVQQVESQFDWYQDAINEAVKSTEVLKIDAEQRSEEEEVYF